MKKFILLAVLTTIIMSRCARDPIPVAEFTVSTSLAQPLENIYFYNSSSRSTNYFWDFGDGYTSYDANPDHYYSNEGSYTVTLKANNRNGSDIARLTVDIYYTKLEITVSEWNQNYIVQNRIPGVSVRLYGNMYDWDHEINLIAEGSTDADGVVVFQGLDQVSYYIDAWRSDYNNFTIRNELPNLISTLPLIKCTTNTFVAWVDYTASKSQIEGRMNITPYKVVRSYNIVTEGKASK